MSDVFILGAGFSKAISRMMPTTKELSREVLQYEFKNSIEPPVKTMLEEDIEKTLTFLAQNKPWLTESENLRHKALYLETVKFIRCVFLKNQMDPCVWGTNKPWKWLDQLLAYWHNNHCSVITLNYDTLIERVASGAYGANRPIIPTNELYPIQLTASVLPDTQIKFDALAKSETFKLFKLHGSINWFYSGRSDFFGEELFYIPCDGGVDRVFDGMLVNNPDKVDWSRLADKSPLIIPPALDKSAFFQHESLRSLWFQAGEAIKKARRVICLGYSLPESDLTFVQFLKTCAAPNRPEFEIVDLEVGNNFESKVGHFERLIGKDLYEFRQEYSGEASIPEFVIKNLIKDTEDKIQAAMDVRPPAKLKSKSDKTL